MFKKVHAERLLSLAAFLRTQVRKRCFNLRLYTTDSDFDDNRTVDNFFDENPSKGCGTQACAIGYLPVAFPEVWVYQGAFPRLRKSLSCWASSFQDSMEWFGLRGEEWAHLFSPKDGDCGGGRRGPRQEADVIEKFVESKGWVDDGEYED